MTVSTADILNAGILIVDDLETNVQLLEQMLRGAGYTRITSTRDPHAVCALHCTNHYDLILLDLRMPGMDGFQVMEGLKEIETDGYLPVLAVTAQPAHKLRALQCGAKDFVSKPFDLAEVLIAGTDKSRQVRARHDDSRRCSSCRHEVMGTVTSFPSRISRSLVARSCAGRPGSTLIAHRSVAVIGDPRW